MAEGIDPKKLLSAAQRIKELRNAQSAAEKRNDAQRSLQRAIKNALDSNPNSDEIQLGQIDLNILGHDARDNTDSSHVSEAAALSRVLTSQQVLEAVGFGSSDEFQALLNRAKGHEAEIRKIAGKFRLREYAQRLEELRDNASPNMSADIDALNAHLLSGGSLDDEEIKTNGALPVFKLANDYKIAEAANELRRSAQLLEPVDKIEERSGTRRTSGALTTTGKVAAATAGTVATGKGMYISALTLASQMGLGIPDQALFWGSMGAGVATMAGIVKFGKDWSKEGSIVKAAKKSPRSAGIWLACSLISAQFASAFVVKEIGTTTRAGNYGNEVLDKVGKFTDIISGGTQKIPAAQELIKQIMERRLAIVEAEVDPSKRGAGVGNTGTVSGYGPVARALEYLLSGQNAQPQSNETQQSKNKKKGKKSNTESQAKSQDLTAKADAVRNDPRFALKPGQSIDQRYAEILDEYAKTERAQAQQVLNEFLAFLQKLQAKGADEYALESVSPFPPTLNPQQISQYKDQLKVAIETLSQKYTEGAKTVGAQFLKDFMETGLKNLNLEQAGIEIPAADITIDTKELETIGQFYSSAFPYPTTEEFAANVKFWEDQGQPWIANIIKNQGEYAYFLYIAAIYFALIDNSMPAVQAWGRRRRERREAKQLPEKLADLHTLEDDLAQRVAGYINSSLLPHTAGMYGQQEQVLVDADYIRFCIRQKMWKDNKNDGFGMLVWDSVWGKMLGPVSQFVWDTRLPGSETFNNYLEILEGVRQQLTTPDGFVQFVSEIVPGSDTLLKNAILDLRKPSVAPGEISPDVEQLLEARLGIQRQRADFIKIRIERSEMLLQHMSDELKKKEDIPDIFRVSERPLDGTGTIFLDSEEFKYGHAFSALQAQLQEDYREFDALSASGVATAGKLQLQQARSALARNEALRLGGTQFPEFVLGRGPVDRDMVAKTLSVEQGVDSALAKRLEFLLSQRENYRKLSESLQFADTHSLTTIRSRLENNELLKNKDRFIGVGYRVSGRGIGGLSIIVRTTEKSPSQKSAEISYQMDEDISSEELDASINQWFERALPELESRAILAQIETTALELRSELENAPLGNSVSGVVTFGFDKNNLSSNDRMQKMVRFLQLRSFDRRLSQLVGTMTKSVYGGEEGATLEQRERIDSELARLFKRDPYTIQIPDLENEQAVDRVRGLLNSAIDNNPGHTLFISFDANRDTPEILITRDSDGKSTTVSLHDALQVGSLDPAIKNLQ